MRQQQRLELERVAGGCVIDELRDGKLHAEHDRVGADGARGRVADQGVSQD